MLLSVPGFRFLNTLNGWLIFIIYWLPNFNPLTIVQVRNLLQPLAEPTQVSRIDVSFVSKKRQIDQVIY